MRGEVCLPKHKIFKANYPKKRPPPQHVHVVYSALILT